MERLRTFLTLIALLFAAAAISAPAAARGLHGISHAAAPVAAGEHHHHHADGDVTAHDADHDAAPQSDPSPIGQFGHSHLASSACDVLPQPVGEMTAKLATQAENPCTANTPALGTLGWSPQKRPPRAA